MKKEDIYFTLYMFVVIFAPPLVPNISTMLIFGVYSFFVLITKYRYRLKNIIYDSGIISFLKLFSVAAIYILLVMVVNEVLYQNGFYLNYATTIYRYYVLIPAMIVHIIYIIAKMDDYSYTLTDFFRIVIYAGILQAIIGLLALIFPSFKEILVTIMHQNTGSNSYFKTPEIYFNRFFGFARSLLDIFGFGMGMLFVFSIYMAIKKNWLYILAAPLLMISILLNARTGIIVAIIGIVFLLPIIYINLIKKERMTSRKWVVLISVLIGGSIASYYIIAVYSPQTLRWVSTAYAGIVSLLKGEGGEYAVGVLFSEEFWTVPGDISILFGNGHTIYGGEVSSVIGYHSDVGYVNDIWLGGIIGMILSYTPFIYIFIKSLKNSKNLDYRLIQSFIFVTFFVVSIKFISITYNPGVILVLAVTFIIIYSQKNLNMETPEIS